MTPDPLVCEHLRVRAACEDCAFVAAQDRPTMRDELHHAPTAQEQLTADKDTLVDVGDGVAVFVAAGDPYPAGVTPPASRRRR